MGPESGTAEATTGHVLVGLAVILAVAALFSVLARKAGQPAVMGEIVAGLALGPSLLGALPGHLTELLFPASARPYLQVLSQVGLVLFMFGVGYHLDTGHLRGTGRQVTAVSVASVALPFGLGVGLALAAPRIGLPDPATVDRAGTALFLGAAMAITAFPVLARIITEHGLQRTRLGSTALASAAVQDLFAWCLLAVVISLVTAVGPWPLLHMAGQMTAFGIVLAVVVRPTLRWFTDPARRWAGRASVIYAVLLAGLLISSWATVQIGLHAVFGAFAFGLIAPRIRIDAQTPEVPERIEQTSLLLLPVFFTVTGLSVDLYGLGAQGAFLVAAVIALACLGKFVGATLAARATGATPRDAMSLGLLLNARGLTELIILNVGLSLGALDQRWFSAMVIMAVVTTLMTGPLLRRVRREPVATSSAGETDVASVAGLGQR